MRARSPCSSTQAVMATRLTVFTPWDTRHEADICTNRSIPTHTQTQASGRVKPTAARIRSASRMDPAPIRHESCPCIRALATFGHLPHLAAAHMREMASWAVDTVLPPGVFITSTPLRVASATSMLSMPTPARPINFKLVALASSSGFAYAAGRRVPAGGGRGRASWFTACQKW